MSLTMNPAVVMKEVREILFRRLEEKTGWGKEEVKRLIDEAIQEENQQIFDRLCS